MNGKIPVMLSLKDASSETGLSYDSLRKMCLSNTIVHIRVGTKFFVNMDKLIEFLNGENNESIEVQ